MRSQAVWAVVVVVAQVLGCCCAFGGYPGTFYQMMLRFNKKDRKYARTAPSPSRLWAILNPAATLGSLSHLPPDSNRVVRRDLELRQEQGALEPPTEGSQTFTGESGVPSGESQAMSEGQEHTSEGSESISKGSESISKGSESISKGSESIRKGSESISEGSESVLGSISDTSESTEPTTERPDPTSDGLDGGSEATGEGLVEGSETTSGGSQPLDEGLNGGFESTSGESDSTLGVSDAINEEPEPVPEESEPTSEVTDPTEPTSEGTYPMIGESSGGSKPASGESSGGSKPSSGESSGGSKPSSGESSGGSKPLSGESSGGPNEAAEPMTEGSNTTSGLLEPVTEGSNTTSGGSEPMTEGSNTTSGGSEPMTEGSNTTSGGLEPGSGKSNATRVGIHEAGSGSGGGSEELEPGSGESNATRVSGVNEAGISGSRDASVELERQEGRGESCGEEMVMPGPSTSRRPTQGFVLKQNITSPGWDDGQYPEEVECVWKLKVGPECEVGLLLYQVVEGEVLQSRRCFQDYLEFVQPNSHAARYCGPLVNNRDKVAGIDSWHSSQHRTTTVTFKASRPRSPQDPSVSGTPQGFVMEVAYYCWLWKEQSTSPSRENEITGEGGEERASQGRVGSEESRVKSGDEEREGSGQYSTGNDTLI